MRPGSSNVQVASAVQCTILDHPSRTSGLRPDLDRVEDPLHFSHVLV